MQVKRFTANTMQEAIDQVKRDFGAGAVILHTRRVRRRGVLAWLRRPRVEVIAAADKNTATTGPSPSPNPPHIKSPAKAVDPSFAQVMRRNVSGKEREKPANGAQQGEDAATRFRARLIEQEVYADFVDEIVHAALQDVKQSQLFDDEGVLLALRRRLESGVQCFDPEKAAAIGQIHCLVGPTGVGKTTTIAKLAANYSLLGKKKVALITLDTYRIAAVEQLRVYAEIIGVPIDVALTPTELKSAIARHEDADLILIDTAGRSQQHRMQMQELRAFAETLEKAHIHLVLSAGTRTKDLFEIHEGFGKLPLHSLIVTKLDETRTYGLLYNASRLTGRPLSYMTIGQSVPDDIEIATPERVADLILGEGRE